MHAEVRAVGPGLFDLLSVKGHDTATILAGYSGAGFSDGLSSGRAWQPGRSAA
jgi:hypothetical protein